MVQAAIFIMIAMAALLLKVPRGRLQGRGGDTYVSFMGMRPGVGSSSWVKSQGGPGGSSIWQTRLCLPYMSITLRKSTTMDGDVAGSLRYAHKRDRHIGMHCPPLYTTALAPRLVVHVLEGEGDVG